MIGGVGGIASSASCGRRGKPLRMLGLVLGVWVALRLAMVCLAIPVGADVAPGWNAERAAMLAVRPAGGNGVQGRYAPHSSARPGTSMRPAVLEQGSLTDSVHVADFRKLPPALCTLRMGLLGLLDETG